MQFGLQWQMNNLVSNRFEFVRTSDYNNVQNKRTKIQSSLSRESLDALQVIHQLKVFLNL